MCIYSTFRDSNYPEPSNQAHFASLEVCVSNAPKILEKSYLIDIAHPPSPEHFYWWVEGRRVEGEVVER